MFHDLTNNYAGNLLEELEEVHKLVPSDEAVETVSTTTEICSAFLTIYCC